MNRPIIKFSKFIVSFLLVLLLFTINVNCQSRKNILYISSGAVTYESTQDQIEGFNDSIRNSHEVYFEHINSMKYPSKEHENSFYSLLKAKLEIYPKFDAIVLSDDVAASFAIKHKQLFKDTPMFITSVNNKEVINKAKELDIECIIEENSSISQNINIISDIYGTNTKKENLILVTGPDDIYSKEIEEFYSLKDKYKNFKFENIVLEFKNEQEINEKLKEFNNNKDVLFFLMPTSYSSSKNLSYFDTNFSSMTQIIKAIINSTNAPVFTTSKMGIEMGMIGGYAVDLYKQGKITGDIVNAFFNSKDNIPKLVKGDDTNSLVFNYKEMIIHGISKYKISKDAELVYELDSILSKYKDIIVLTFIIFIIISISTITHYILTIRSNKKLKEAKIIAEKANISKDMFITNISHELRTPVAVISSAAQLINRNININKNIDLESICSNLNKIEQNSYRLTRLINNIIDVTKSDTGENSLIRQNVEIIGLIENSVLSVVPFADTKNINIIFDTEYEELIMAVDIDKIDRIVLNLLSNAIKFSNNGGDILVNLMRNKDNLIIEVTDFGIGISDENIDRIFEKFTQIDNGLTRLNEGSGIGLSIVKSFVTMHKGDINVKSKLGEGTTFKISIPINIINNGKIIYNIREMNSTCIELSDIYI